MNLGNGWSGAAGRDSHSEPNHDLMRDALVMSVNKNLLDVTTLLQWAHDASDAGDKLGHVRQALVMMRDLEAQLTDLSANQTSPRR